MLTKNLFFFITIALLIISCKKDDNEPKNIIQEPTLVQWYVDGDTDGFGNPDSNVGKMAVTKPEGFVMDNSDCDDTDDTINPQAEEDDYDGIDSNCDNQQETIITTFSKTLTLQPNVSENVSQSIRDSNGNILTTGYKFVIGAPDFDNHYNFWIIKHDIEGTLLWEKSFGGSEADIAHSIISTSDGGYVICGASQSSDRDVASNVGETDWLVMKLNNDGNLLWSKSFGGSSFDTAYDVIETDDLSYLIVGNSKSNDGYFNQEGSGTAFIKLDQNGDEIWVTRENVATKSADATHIVQLTDGTFMAVGRYGYQIPNENGSNSQRNSSIVYRLSEDGQFLWRKELGEDGGQGIGAIAQAPDGSVLIGGRINVNNLSDDQAWLLNISTDGEINWSKGVENGLSDFVSDIKFLPTGDFLLTGWVSRQAWVAEFSSNGTMNWQEFYGGSSSDRGIAIFELNGQGYIISGTTESIDQDIVDRTDDEQSISHWLFKIKPNRKF